MNICFFTIANTLNATHLANILSFTFKKYNKNTLKVFTNYKNIIQFGDTFDLLKIQHEDCLHKLKYFEHISNLVKADYYIYLDPNNIVVKPIENLEKILNNPMQIFLQNELKELRYKWYDKKLEIINILFNEYSKKNTRYFNVDSSFFGFRKDLIEEIFQKASEIKINLSNKIKYISDDYILSYLAGEYIEDIENLKLKNNFNLYAIDNNNFFKDGFPRNQEWVYTDFITNKQEIVNPSVIKYKDNNNDVIIQFSKQILSKPYYKNIPFSKFENMFNFIITCSSHQFNLPLIIKSIENSTIKNLTNYNIFVVFDDKIKIDDKVLDYCKNIKNLSIHILNIENQKLIINKILPLIKEGWIYQLNDQDILHSKFLTILKNYILENPDVKFFIFPKQNDILVNFENINFDELNTNTYLIDKNLAVENLSNNQYSLESLKKKNNYLLIKDMISYKEKLSKLDSII